MSLRTIALLAAAGMIAVTAGCVVEQPRPRRVVYEAPPPPGPAYVEVVAPQPPPVAVVEEIPPPRAGYIWARGYWRWDGRRYVAEHGHWEVARPGYRYQHPHWEQGRDGGWHFRAGVWVGG